MVNETMYHERAFPVFPLSVTRLAGGLMIQLCVGLILTGITYSQAYSYSLMSNKDSWLLKTVVAMTVILETVNSGFCIHIIYYFFIENFGNFLGLNVVGWSVKGNAITIISTLILARIFNGYRVYHVSRKNLILTTAVAGFSAANTALALATTSFMVKSATWTEYLANKTANATFIVTISLGVFDDILVGSILIYYLARMKTGFRRTDKLITTMIVYVVNTGLMTAFILVLVLILYCVMGDTFMYQGAYSLAGRIYGVAIIGTLNQRTYFKDPEPAISTDNDFPLSVGVNEANIEGRQTIRILKTVIQNSDEAESVRGKYGHWSDNRS